MGIFTFNPNASFARKALIGLLFPDYGIGIRERNKCLWVLAGVITAPVTLPLLGVTLWLAWPLIAAWITLYIIVSNLQAYVRDGY